MSKLQQNSELLKVLPSDDILQQCIHCGMCLATCPTYDLTKLERSSPRGRIRMIRSVARGEMVLSSLFAEEMNFCLDCQACETACPAGVKYGRMVEAARVLVDESGYTPKVQLFLKRFALRKIVASRFWLKFFSRLLWFYQKSGIQKLIRATGILKLFPKNFSEIEKLSPPIAGHFSDSRIKEIELPNGEIKYKTAFHFGCLMNTMFADINIDTIDVLKEVGCKIITPKDQVCCGSLMAHNGDMEFALKLARKNIDAFDKHDYDYLISNSAGCGAFMKDYAHLLENDPDYSEKAKRFSSKVKDVMEFFAEQKPLNGISISNPELNLKLEHELITYHDACHLAHAQKVFLQPREVIKSLPGIKYTELEEASWCCGSAGIYNVVRYEDAVVQLQRKMKNIRNTGAKIVLTGNPGCMGQIKYGAEKFNVDVKVLHPITLIKKFIS
ncbi:MAG: (Fe-S)-binding protein [Ignavibacterium sp.]|jgi:glycolate oxidase iron-sulfur subunit|uniref:(Fe-S)-binding protein n=1 Tax=Ignavibacterium sp. TaxID=2651167 RepID=UPI003296F667